MIANKNRETIELMAAHLQTSAPGRLVANESHLTLAITHASNEDVKHRLSTQNMQFHLHVQQTLRLCLEAWTSMMSLKEDDCQDPQLLRDCLLITQVLPARLGLSADCIPTLPASDQGKWDGQVAGHAKKGTSNPGMSRLARVTGFLTRFANSDRWSMSDLADSDFDGDPLEAREDKPLVRSK